MWELVLLYYYRISPEPVAKAWDCHSRGSVDQAFSSTSGPPLLGGDNLLSFAIAQPICSPRRWLTTPLSFLLFGSHIFPPERNYSSPIYLNIFLLQYNYSIFLSLRVETYLILLAFYVSLFLALMMQILCLHNKHLQEKGARQMTIKRTLVALLLLLMPLTTYALPMNNLPSMNSSTTLFFFNTLYSSRLLNFISNDTCPLSSTIKGPYPEILKGSLPKPPSQPLTTNISCIINPNQPPTNHPAPVPEPATMLLVGSGMMGIATFKKFFQKK